VPVGSWLKQREVTSIQDEAGSNDVSIDCCVAACPAAGLDFDDDAMVLMERVDLVRDLGATVVAKQNRPTNLAGGRLTLLDEEPESPQSRRKVSEDRVGPVLAAIFVAEIDDVTRFPDPGKLCSWAGLTPRHRESDTTVHRGPITKQGSRLVRWAAIEAIQLTRSGTKLSADKAAIIARRGRNIGKVAAARKLLTLVYYGLRDGHIRSLAAARPA
jgi:Transposase IS116/IS110/IS902 family